MALVWYHLCVLHVYIGVPWRAQLCCYVTVPMLEIVRRVIMDTPR